MYISGPVSHYKYEIGSKTYYLFGDYHESDNTQEFDEISTFNENKEMVVKNPNYVDIGYWLLNLVNSINDVDIFIETKYRLTSVCKPVLYDKTNILTTSCYIFDNYLSHQYNTIRAHYIDIRLLGNFNNTLRVNVCQHISVTKNNNKINLIKQIWYYDDLYYRDLHNSLIGDYVVDIYENTSLSRQMKNNMKLLVKDGKHKIKKQLDKLGNKTINGYLLKDTIISFILEQYKNLNLVSRVNEMFKHDDIDETNNFDEILPYIIRAGSLFVDAYTLGRFFRDFGENDNTKVVLAGFMHIELYRTFFAKIGLTPIVTVSNVKFEFTHLIKY